MTTRSAWAHLTDRQLLDQCEVDTYRASGPGGQKRNKTSSAVRLRHPPSGLIVIAEESRSQHENRARALRRLRRGLFLHLREPFPPSEATRILREVAQHQLKLGLKDERFWPVVGLALDALAAHTGRVSEAAAALGVSTGGLVSFLESEPKLWAQANELRKQFGHKVLKFSGSSQNGRSMSQPQGFSWIERRRLAAMGRPDGMDELRWLKQQGIEILVSLTEDPLGRRDLSDAGLLVYHVPVPDMTAPTQEELDRCVSAIQKARAGGMGVGVHCAAGQGRTGVVLACYFIAEGEKADDAIRRIRRLRPGSIETEEQADAVREYANRRQA